MELWMYLVVIGMFLVAIVGTVWITLWTIQRGERARSSSARVRSSFGYNADEAQRERFNTTAVGEGDARRGTVGEEDVSDTSVGAATHDREP